MPGPFELFRRECTVLDRTGCASPLLIRFFPPERNPHGADYLAHATISCRLFSKDVYATGEDVAQAFFSLPKIVTSYLAAKRNDGFESYWLERGDLDYQDFWSYLK